MQDSSSLNLISAYSDSDASSDAGASPSRPSTQNVAAQSAADVKVAVDHTSLASQELQVSRGVASSQPATLFLPPPQMKVRRAVQHSLTTGRTFNEQLRSHTDFRNPAIVTQLAARFGVSLLDSNLPPSVWSPRGLDPEGVCVPPPPPPLLPKVVSHHAINHTFPASFSLLAIRRAAEKRAASRRAAPHRLADFVGCSAPPAKTSKWD
jgi:hypothetical protein